MVNQEHAVLARRAAVSDYKRSLIRDAAKGVFATDGIDRSSMRSIARAAGYTTGAIYVHYATKEELYADVLRESLAALVERLEPVRDRPRAALHALLAFYRERPQDFDLSFYLYGGGVRPVGLNDALNAELNGRMAEVIDLIGEGLGGRHHGTAATTHVFGVLLMEQTGRLQILGESAEALVDTYLEAVDAPR